MSATPGDWLDALAEKPPGADIPAVRHDLARLYSQPSIAKQRITRAALPCLAQMPALRAMLAAAGAGVAHLLAQPGCIDALRQPLVVEMLRHSLVEDLAFEAMLAAVRRCALADPQVARRLGADFLGALAEQCFLDQYLFTESDVERAALPALAERARTELDDLLLYAAYRPLPTLGLSREILLARDSSSEALRRVVMVQVDEPLQEARYAAATPTFGSIAAASDPVREQYEHWPYPRWKSIRVPQGRALAHDVASRFPHAPPMAGTDRPRILVAGAGTGSAPIRAALRYPSAHVTAIDISARSLGEAQRQAQAHGVDRIEFLRGDLMDVAQLGRAFDFVECFGVLHHLADPARALDALTGVLASGGYIELALYSARGRVQYDTAQAYCAAHGAMHLDAAGLRELRQQVIKALQTREFHFHFGYDFYSLSGFRDLLCHAREARYTPAQVAQLLRAGGLQFVGIGNWGPKSRARYAQSYPDDPCASDLARIDAFDAEDPQRLGMIIDYWARKP